MINYEQLKTELQSLLAGEVFDDVATLKSYSHDASIFEVTPKLIIWPKDNEDIKKLVTLVNQKKKADPAKFQTLSITVRAAGTCMSGGSLNESIIIDVTKYLNKFSIDPETLTAEVEPGVFYRDFEKESLKHNLLLPCYPASKNICALGGMIGNNAAGEKTLQHGNMENFVKELSVVLQNGEETNFQAISRPELLQKSHETNFASQIYGLMKNLVEQNRAVIEKAKPRVSKNSTGYYLWNIEQANSFDLTKILVGSQGTLGIVTKAKIKLERIKPQSKLLVIFMQSTERLGDLVNTALAYEPESIESFDRATFKLALRFLPEIIKIMKSRFLKLLWSFWPEIKIMLTGKVPELVLLVEFVGEDENAVDQKIKKLTQELKTLNYQTYLPKNPKETEKYWTIRRESFNLLRKHIKNKKATAFIYDLCVKPEHLPKFLPALRQILDEAKLTYTIAGHAGNGNFHIIPLMDMTDHHNRALIPIICEKVFDLVKKYDGSIAAEHNDGIIRTPYLNKMYSPEILKLFQQTKQIFDPLNIFNPGKKVPGSSPDGGGTVEYMVGHLAKN
jgi:FAD/FMN-containing dehydrogenase